MHDSILIEQQQHVCDARRQVDLDISAKLDRKATKDGSFREDGLQAEAVPSPGQVGILEGKVEGFYSVELSDQPPLETREKAQSFSRSTITTMEKPRKSCQLQNTKHTEKVEVPGATGTPINLTALAAGVLSSIFFALGVLIVKLLPKSDGVQREAKALFFRGAFMSTICAVVLVYRRGSLLIPRNEIWITSLRSLTGSMRIVTSYLALRYISAGDSVALLFTSALWTNVLSFFIFGEKLKATQILALPVSFVGIIMVANPALLVGSSALQISASEGANQTAIESATAAAELLDIAHRWPGVILALASSFLCSLTFIVLKFRKSTPIQTTTFWLGLSMSATAVAMALSDGAQPSDLPQSVREWILLVLLGLVSWLGQVTIQWALHHERAGLLAILRSLDVPVTFTLGAILLGEHVYWTSMVGAAIIALVVGSLMLNDWLKTLSASDQVQSEKKDLKVAIKKIDLLASTLDQVDETNKKVQETKVQPSATSVNALFKAV